MGTEKLIFNDVQIILQDYSIPDEEANTIRKIIDTYPESVYREWLSNARDKGARNPGAYLNGCIRQYEKEQDALEQEELYGPPKREYREAPYQKPDQARTFPGSNTWTNCHDCKKYKPCTYWNDPIEDARHAITVHAGAFDWYCDYCYRKRTDKADRIWIDRKRRKAKDDN